MPSGDLGTVEVPGSLRALVAARLDGLEPDARTLVQDAAVLGQTFSLDALVGVSGERSVGPRAAPARSRAAGDPGARHRPALPRAWPVRLRAGAAARGRLRDACEAGPPHAPPRGRPPLRGARRRRARRRAGDALPGGLRSLPPGRRPMPSRSRPGSPSGAPPTGPPRSERTSRPSPSPSRPCRSHRTWPSRRPPHPSARSSDLAGHYEQSEAFVRQALEASSGSGMLPASAAPAPQLGQGLIDAGRVGDAVPVLEAGLAAMPAGTDERGSSGDPDESLEGSLPERRSGTSHRGRRSRAGHRRAA